MGTRNLFEYYLPQLTFTENKEKGREMLYNFWYNSDFKTLFSSRNPNMLIETEDGVILCHVEILENLSGYFHVKIVQWMEEFGERCERLTEQERTSKEVCIGEFPVIDLKQFDFKQVFACIKFFYTHELTIQHTDISQDLAVLVNILNNSVLKQRYKVIHSKYTKYKLYQYGDKQAYSFKNHKIYHRAGKRVGTDDISDKLLKSSKLFKIDDNYGYEVWYKWSYWQWWSQK